MRLQHTVDKVLLRLSAHLADTVRDAQRATLNIADVVTAFLDTYPETTVTRQQARDWARMNVRVNEEALYDAIDEVWASGWVLGLDYANESVKEAFKRKAIDFTVDWSKWKPGDAAAEAIVRPPGGLRRLMNRRRRMTVNGITTTNLDRIGTVLADGLAAGASGRDVARRIMELGIRGILDDAKRALTIALTESARAVQAATVDRYTEMGLAQVEWFALEGCDACEENANEGPQPLGYVFPSGDEHPPAHPNCRCALMPYVEGSSVALRSVDADLVKFDDSQPRDELGRWTSDGSLGVAAVSYNPNARIFAKSYNPALGTSGIDATNFVAQRYEGMSVTPEQEKVFADYQDKTFLPINQALRSGEVPEEYKEQIRIMDEVINNAPTREVSDDGMSIEKIYYRGVDASVVAGLQPGDTIIDQGYTSVSTSRTDAVDMGYDQLVIIREDSSSGSAPAVWINAVNGSSHDASRYDQNELIFGRGTPFVYNGLNPEGTPVFTVGKYVENE